MTTETTLNLIIVTGEDIYNAAEKNGFGIIREEWITDGKACILGQAALNLGVSATSHYLGDLGMSFRPTGNPLDDPYRYTLSAQLSKLKVPENSPWGREGNDLDATITNNFDEKIYFWDWIIDRMGGDKYYSLKDKYDHNRESFYKFMDPINGPLKKYWKEFDNLYPTQVGNDGDETRYKLTYEQALVMLKDLLTPHWTEKFQLIAHEYPEVFNDVQTEA